MTRIFISHSSKDIKIAEQLAIDLRNNGYSVWLDMWQIKVGQSIVQEIEQGIESANFLIVLLSGHAVASNWVNHEWKTAYWDEVNEDTVIVLPVLIEKCQIPKLLRTKKYANISESYAQGLSEIFEALKYYETTTLNSDFFYAVERVRSELVNVDEIYATFRHSHWDNFQDTVTNLDSPEQRRVQKLNTQYYLNEWSLSVVQLKKVLIFLGLFNGELNEELSDDVIEAIIRFQRNYNLRHIDGVFGPLTYSEMEKIARSIIDW